MIVTFNYFPRMTVKYLCFCTYKLVLPMLQRKKETRLELRIDDTLLHEFRETCKKVYGDKYSVSQILRGFMKSFVSTHGSNVETD